MKHDPDQSQLLDTLLEEDSFSQFQGQLLEQTLTAVRRKKRARQFRNGLIIAAVLSLFFLPARRQTVMPLTAGSQSARPFETVQTHPLTESMIVKTRPASVDLFSSSESSFALIETGKVRSHLEVITDEELFALVPGEAKLLVWHAPHEAELLVLNPLTPSQ